MLHLCFMFSAMLSLAAPVRICVVCPALSIEKHCYPALLESGSHDIDRTHPSSRTKYTSLTTPEKHQRLQRLHSELRKTNKQIERLREKVAVLIMDGQEEVDQELDSDIREMVEEHEGSALEAYPENSSSVAFSGKNRRKHRVIKDKRPMR